MNTNYNWKFNAAVLKNMVEDSKLDKTRIEYLIKYSKSFREHYFSLRNAIWKELLYEGVVVRNELINEALSGTDIFDGICKMQVPLTNAPLKGKHFFYSEMDKILEETSESEEAVYNRMTDTFQKMLNGIAEDLDFNIYSVSLNREKEVYELEFSVRDTSDDLY